MKKFVFIWRFKVVIWFINKFGLKVVGVVDVITLSSRQYCVILDPIGADGKSQLGKKKLVKGERSFFLQPGEKLESGIQDVYVLGEDEGLILKCVEGFDDGKVIHSSSIQFSKNQFSNNTIKA